MEICTEKKFAAGLSIFSNASIIVLKLVAGFISGSISVISEAIHSLSDLLASVLAFFSVMKSSEPADSDHPFGHGKYEDMSGFLEGILIVIAGLYIIYEAVKKLCNPVESFETELGIIVMLVAVLANYLVSKYLFYVAKKSDSISLFADAEHLRTDVYSSLGVFAGLLIIKFTGLNILDPVIAIVVAVVIMKTGLSVSKKALNNLLDGSLPEDNLQIIELVVKNFMKSKKIAGFKNLKSRRVGPQKNVELTILFNCEMTIADCHSICDEIEDAIIEQLGNCQVFIHAEPENKVSKISKTSRPTR